ncbi:MAG: hypothetical protein MSS51_10625, partial [Bacteroidales bacterium]|nr:hypothetical protein [Bacteroidales bacterium]
MEWKINFFMPSHFRAFAEAASAKSQYSFHFSAFSPPGGLVVVLQSQLLAELILRAHDGVGHCVQFGHAVAWLTAASISEFESGLSFVAAGMLPGMPRAVMSSFVTAEEPVTIPCASVTSLR